MTFLAQWKFSGTDSGTLTNKLDITLEGNWKIDKDNGWIKSTTDDLTDEREPKCF